LVPVAFIAGFFVQKNNSKESRSFSNLPIPWFILGFLAVSGINSLGIIPTAITQQIVTVAYLLIGMAMAGLGLNVDLMAFKKFGTKSFLAGLIGSIMLSILGYILVFAFGLN
jgi:uncharacterized membrane protein YadS